MQLLFPKSALMNGQMVSVSNHPFGKYAQVGPFNAPVFPHRWNAINHNNEGKFRRRRSNHSLVATMDPVAVARRNERERNRVKQVNDGFDELRQRVPFLPDKKKLSKVEILRCAMLYIRDLKGIVEEFDCNNSVTNYNNVTSSKRKNSEGSSSSEDERNGLLESCDEYLVKVEPSSS